ncbi:hypothetical protein [Metarhizobium album]|uniref:hypothetical protein n=1 Tax=Metarhizobium album TaxID=2182425 RepID=UPI00197F7368|nr:hypothetical protein [Rhizobium album]
MFDGKAFGAEIVSVVKDYLAKEIDGLSQRIGAVERQLSELPVARDGKDADLDVVRHMLQDEIGSLRQDLVRDLVPTFELPDIDTLVSEAVGRLPPAKDGEPGTNGKDVDMGVVSELVKAEVAAKVLELPQPKDGVSVTIEEMRPVIDIAVDAAVKALPPRIDGKDGVGLAGAFIDRSGSLVVTLTDGKAVHLGEVVGKDSDERLLQEKIDQRFAALPKPRDGVDGLGFDDLQATFDGEKTIRLSFVRGGQSKEFAFTLPIVIDRGVYKDGHSYTAGDGVTWGGSFWIAQSDTNEKPDSGKGWRLAVKKGRDGRHGDPGKPGEPGKPGMRGRDLTQVGPDGTKW